jgi:hypothetical protein
MFQVMLGACRLIRGGQQVFRFTLHSFAAKMKGQAGYSAVAEYVKNKREKEESSSIAVAM